MKQRSGHLPVLLAACALLLALPAAAVPVDGSFGASGSVRLEGPHLLDWSVLSATLLDAEGALELELEVEGGLLTVVNNPRLVLVQDDPIHGRRTSSFEQDEQVVHQGPVEGRIVLRAHPVGLPLVRVLPGEPGASFGFSSDGDRAFIEPWGAAWVPPRETTLSHDTFVTDRALTVAGGTAAHVAAGNQTLADTFLVATSVQATLPDGSRLDVPGRRLNESRTDPVTGSGVETYDLHFLVLEAERVTIRTGGDWHLAARSVAGTLDGTAVWHGVHGTLEVAGDRNDDPTLLEVEGQVALDGRLDEDRPGWNLRGEATQVRVDLIDRVPVQVAGGLSLLGLLTAAAFGLRHVVAGVVGRLSRHGTGGDALANDARQRIMGAIHEQQPVRLPELQAHTGLGRSTLRYHLRVLESAHHIQSHAPGARNRTYMLNGGSLTFRVRTEPEHDPEDAPVAAAALSIAASNPVRAALYQGILLRDRATQDELLEDLSSRELTVSRSTCSYHLGLMVRGGLLRTEWRDGRKHFLVAVDARDARVEQYRRYLHKAGALALVRAIDRDGPLDRDAAVQWLSRASASRSAHLLTRLCRLGILDERADRYHLGRTVSSIAARLGDAP